MIVLSTLNKDNVIQQKGIVSDDYARELITALKWLRIPANQKKFKEDYHPFYLFEPLKTFETNELDELIGHIKFDMVKENTFTKEDEIGDIRFSVFNFLTNLSWSPYNYRWKFMKK